MQPAVGALPETLCGVSRANCASGPIAARLLSSFWPPALIRSHSSTPSSSRSFPLATLLKKTKKNAPPRPPRPYFLKSPEKIRKNFAFCSLSGLLRVSFFPKLCLLYSLPLTSTICFSHHSSPFTTPHTPPNPHPPTLSLHLFFPNLALSPRPANRA